MKKHLFCLILISCFLAIQSSYAAKPKDPIDITINGITYRLYENNKVSVYTADRGLQEARILDKVEYQGQEYPVTSISNAFEFNQNLTSVVIGDNVKSLSRSFWRCKNLTSVTFGKSIIEIGKDTFNGCTSLKSVVIPNTVTILGDSAFIGCTNLTSISIPASVNSIGDRAFENCTGLTSVTLAYSSDATLGKNMFKGCSALNTINISDHVTNLGERAFSGCTGLQTVTLPGNIKEAGNCIFLNCANIISAKIEEGWNLIPKGMFSGCENLKNVEMSPSINKILHGAFASCSKLQDIDLQNIEYIDSWSFSECKTLSNLNFSNKLTHIESWAFYGCNSLVEVTIPQSVYFINNCAFGNCENLETVYNYRPNPQRGEENLYVNAFYESYPEYMTLHVPVGCKERYASIQEWNFGTIIDDLENPTSITDIESGENADIDYAEPFEVYNTQGQLVGNSLGELSNGLYIIRQGNKTEKKLVK